MFPGVPLVRVMTVAVAAVVLWRRGHRTNLALLVMPMSLVTAPLGVRAAHAMSKRTLETAFGCYLFIVGSRFVMSLVGGQ